MESHVSRVFCAHLEMVIVEKAKLARVQHAVPNLTRVSTVPQMEIAKVAGAVRKFRFSALEHVAERNVTTKNARLNSLMPEMVVAVQVANAWQCHLPKLCARHKVGSKRVHSAMKMWTVIKHKACGAKVVPSMRQADAHNVQ